MSLHPEEWTSIARLGGRTYRLRKSGARFLDVPGGSGRDPATLAWAEREGFLAPRQFWRVTEWDPEREEDVYSDFESEAEARRESEVRSVYEDIADPVPVSGHVFAPRGEEYWHEAFARSEPVRHELAEDFAPIFHARALGLDGVWWNDDYDPPLLSAPRGAIFRPSEWEVEEVGAHRARHRR